MLLRLLHSQLGRSYSIRYRSEVMAVYNLVVIQQCRPLPQEPDAGQSLVSVPSRGGAAKPSLHPVGLLLLDISQLPRLSIGEPTASNAPGSRRVRRMT